MEAGAKGSSNAIETGVASWYGPNFHGKLTANGEVYDMDGMTAAHRTLPFNSEVVVENLDNGKTTRVRINDRGPFAKNRIIDLSRAAATEIDMIGPGTARVRLYLVVGDLENSRVTDLKVANFTIQLGSFSEEILALQESDKIEGSRVEPVTVNGTLVYRVYYGLYQDTAAAQSDLEALQLDGFDGFVKQIEND
jgi:rare lipoprotein A